jgi:hypothetical protein
MKLKFEVAVRRDGRLVAANKKDNNANRRKSLKWENDSIWWIILRL